MELQTHNPPAAQAATDIRTAEGFAAAAESLTRLLYAVSYAILQNSDACADAVQAALLKAWETRDRVQSAAGFPGYLVRIVQNESRDLLRHRRRHGTLPLDPDVAAAPARPARRSRTRAGCAWTCAGRSPRCRNRTG